MCSWQKFVCGLTLVTAGNGLAQVGEDVTTAKSCSYFGEPMRVQVISFASDQEAEDVVKRIVDASGLAKNFEIRAAAVPNAAAVIQETKRYILYNQYFMDQTRSATNSSWGPVSIMAHEVGHHLNGHTLSDIGSRPRTELEADYFSGFVLQRMGATLEEARLTMEKLGAPGPTATHPAKADRLAAITNGWKRSCDSNPACKQTGIGPDLTKRNPDADSCEYAFDGECDEPELCREGSDTSDCRGPVAGEATTNVHRPQTSGTRRNVLRCEEQQVAGDLLGLGAIIQSLYGSGPANFCCFEGGQVPLAEPGSVCAGQSCYMLVNILGMQIPQYGIACIR